MSRYFSTRQTALSEPITSDYYGNLIPQENQAARFGFPNEQSFAESPHFRFVEKAEPREELKRKHGSDANASSYQNSGWYNPAAKSHGFSNLNENIQWQEITRKPDHETIPHHSLIPALNFLSYEQQVALQKWWNFLPPSPKYEESIFNKTQQSLSDDQNQSIEVYCDEMPEPFTSLDDLQVESFIKNNLLLDNHYKLSLAERYASTLFINRFNFVAYIPKNVAYITSYLIPVINKLQQNGPYKVKDAISYQTLPAALVIVSTPSKVYKVFKEALKLTYTSNIEICSISEENVEMMANLRSGCNLLITTPKFLEDLVRRDVISLKAVETLVYDGFDQILDLGLESNLISTFSFPGAPDKSKTQTVLYSSQLTSEMSRTMKNFIQNHSHFKITNKFIECENIGSVSLYYVDNDTCAQAAQELLIDINFELHYTLLIAHDRFIKPLTEILTVNNMPTASFENTNENIQNNMKLPISCLENILHDKSFKIVVTSLDALNSVRIPYHFDHVLFFNLPSSLHEFLSLAKKLKKTVFWSNFISDNDKNISKEFYYFLKSIKKDFPDWLYDFSGANQTEESTMRSNETIIGKNININLAKSPHIKINKVDKLKSWLKKRRLARQS